MQSHVTDKLLLKHLRSHGIGNDVSFEIKSLFSSFSFFLIHDCDYDDCDGDAGDEASIGLAKTLDALGLRLRRMKTGQQEK
jgi:hypothetical protein